MKIFSLLIALIAFTLLSCQKEFNPIDSTDNTQPPVADTLLTKIIYKEGSDSTTTIISYDSNKQLLRYDQTGFMFGDSVRATSIFFRNASGKVDRILEHSYNFGSNSFDLSVYVLQYDAAGRVKYMVNRSNFMGVAARDSFIYNYDAQQRVTQQLQYSTDYNPGSFGLYSKIVYTYSGVNLATRKRFYYYNGQEVPDFDDVYVFDDKINPYPVRTDGIGEGRHGELLEPLMPHNCTFYQMNYPSGSVDHTRTATYTYDASGRPITLSYTYLGNGNTWTAHLRFYYQVL